jgi:DNA-binding transcriptional LysR family regulator
LSITAAALFGRSHVLPVVTEFLRANPQVQVRLLLLDRLVSLADEGMDLAVRLGPLEDSTLKARLIGQVQEVLCASPGYLDLRGVPRTPEQLAKHDCIAFTATTPIPDRWSFTGPSGRERTVGVRVRLVVNAGDAAIDAAVSGVGIVRALSYQVAPLLTQGKLRAVLRGFSRESVPVQFVHLSGAPSRAAAAFMEFAHPRLRERLKA